MVRSVDVDNLKSIHNFSNWGFRDKNSANISSFKFLTATNSTETKRGICWINHVSIFSFLQQLTFSEISWEHRLKFRATLLFKNRFSKAWNCVCSKSISKFLAWNSFNDFPAKSAINLNSLSSSSWFDVDSIERYCSCEPKTRKNSSAWSNGTTCLLTPRYFPSINGRIPIFLYGNLQVDANSGKCLHTWDLLWKTAFALCWNCWHTWAACNKSFTLEILRNISSMQSVHRAFKICLGEFCSGGVSISDNLQRFTVVPPKTNWFCDFGLRFYYKNVATKLVFFIVVSDQMIVGAEL